VRKGFCLLYRLRLFSSGAGRIGQNQAIALLEGLIPVEEIQSKDNRSQSLSDSMPPEPPTDDADLDLQF